ncbi:protein sel-1 homolog 3 [Takifugu flavidus]|uniref:Protein sel-1-like protein 3 n=1 Tax=Takifugu flavidus TaxID=433684 RepID=A0A5C6PFG9_9TELE|nr:protein sel-1 homolog 3 [Takifugu flavidus]TWW76970.1 Protein sel-1 -like protein 3 [Takifugu flavidus]
MCVLSLGGVCRPLNIYLQQREVEQDHIRITRHLSPSLNVFIMEIPVRILSFLYFLCVQVVWGLDQVKLLNPPQQPVPGHFLKILFSCDKPASVQLDCMVTFDTGVTATHTLRRWRCLPSDPKIHILELKLPDWLVYRADGIVPASQEVLSCILLASIRRGGLEESVAAQDVASLQLQSHFDRPVKEHPLCFSWSTQMLRLTHRYWIKLCPVERETVHLLSSIYASTGEGFGITKTLEAYTSPYLEHTRLKAVTFPWCTFSVWVLMTRHCQHRLCGLFYHLDSEDNYATPALFLTASGQLHVQMKGKSGESAFTSTFRVPLSRWCQISVMMQGATATVSMLCVDETQRTFHSMEHTFDHVTLDDTEGYFVIGGGKYIHGMEGYFGPLVYYRNRIPPDTLSEAVIPDVIRIVNLTGWVQSCQAFQLEMTVKIGGYFLMAEYEAGNSCLDVFHEWMVKDRQTFNSQCGLWEETAPRRKKAAKLAKFLTLKHGRRTSLPAVGRALYSLSCQKLEEAGTIAAICRTLPLLLQAGCLGESKALYMSSVLYSTDLGVKKQPWKVWLLALLAAQRDDRLALLQLGHMHHRGVHGLTVDPDLAYAYYANIAQQTILDRQNPTPEQTYVEAVYLNDDETLNQQTNEKHHIFQWLRLQARRGTVEAEQALARMLYWGYQGVTPNIRKAVRHYERGAVQLEDPVSMYDYGIVLLQGQGVEKDIPKAVTFLQKAMDQGFVPAINALAWYYEQFEQDYKRAVELWEQADLLLSPDAALNLGVVHSQGLYPGKAADQYMAYKYYEKAAERGHIRGAISLAEVWTTGIPGRVGRHPADAVLWVKWAAEHNGHLGGLLRKALNSYLERDIFPSLLFYMMAAESGYAAAQFNAAYLCEQHARGLLDHDSASRCMRRYYNLTIQGQNPNTYALIRMGDLLHEGHKDPFTAAEMYTKAALRNDPQGWYSLGLLIEDGFSLPLSILLELGLSELYLADRSLLLSTLYSRCRDSENTDSYLPCSLALFNVHLQSFQREYGAAMKFSVAVAVVAVLCSFGAIRRSVISRS